MSLTFSITYQNNLKKVTCQRTSSVGQLAAAALEKFKLPSSTAAVLVYGGKRLDGASPIRFTNLINNSKLTLETTSPDAEVTLKVIGTVEGKPVSHVMKLKADVVLPALVSEFLHKSGSSVPVDTKFVKLTMMQNSADSAMAGFASMTVGSLVGSVSSAAVRLYIEDKADMLKREAVLQQHNQARKQYEELQRAQRKAEDSSQAKAPPPAKQATPEPTPTAPVPGTTSPEKPVSGGAASVSDRAAAVSSAAQTGVAPVHNESSSIEREPTVTPPATSASASRGSENTPAEMPNRDPSHNSESAESDKMDVDTLYVPQTSTKIYENPDKDYELTTSQAEKYYNMLKTMQKRPQTKKALPKKPSRYVIRIRFPDRALLDLQLEGAANLGKFLKKLDSYLHPDYINSYVLKNGFPPFKEIKVGFSENSAPLHEHPDFQQEKILLIWEPTIKSTSASYLKPGINTRDVSELPTVVLESNRENLEDEPTRKTSKPVQREEKAKPSSGFPKWFKR